MLSLHKPRPEHIREFLARQATLPFSYPQVGATAAVPPAGYMVQHTHVPLGQGEKVFAAAKAALERWEEFRLGWVETWPPQAPIQQGQIIVVIARCVGLWWLNASRIVYVVNEPGPVRRFGFAYGTLPGHAESGEERFQVEWHPDSDDVFYDILAFSRHRHLLARLGSPMARRMQGRFARDSAAAMGRAVRPGTGE